MNNILIGISTYNEIENLPTLIPLIDQYLPGSHLLIVDDNSPDGTGEWAKQLAAVRDDVVCVQRAGKLGLGTATIATLQYAIDHDYRFVINMDADLSHHPKYLPALVQAMADPSWAKAADSAKAASDAQESQPGGLGGQPRLDADQASTGDARGHAIDVAVGSRYVTGGGVKGWPLRRRLMSRCVNWLARLLLRLPTKDCSGSFRCYRVSALRRIALGRIRSRGYSFFEEVLWHLRHAGATFVEVPIEFQDRERGESKINMREAVIALRIIGTLAFSKP